MKFIKTITTVAVTFALLAGPAAGLAADKAAKAKPYPLKTCVVTDEKLGEHGKPYVFTHKGQEIQMCCKACLKDFDKDPAPYLKKIEKAQKEKK